MIRSLIVFFAFACCDRLMAADDASPFPPIGERYANIPDDAADIVKRLKKLEARLEIGINFVDYQQAIAELYPEVKVFVESAETKDMPELRFVLTNAMDCYLKVRELWAVKVSSDSPIRKYEASMQLITAQPTLWKVAAANTSGAAAIIASPKSELGAVQGTIANGLETLTARSAMETASRQLTEAARLARAKESGVPIPESDATLEALDLVGLLFQEREFGDKLSIGNLIKQMPSMFSKVPPAAVEGLLPLMEGDERKGGISGFIYTDVATASKAYTQIRTGLGAGAKRVSRLGNVAEAVPTSIVFRRGLAVVHVVSFSGSQDVILDGLRKVDARLAEALGPGEPESEASEETGVAAAAGAATTRKPVDPDSAPAGTEPERPTVKAPHSKAFDIATAIKMAQKQIDAGEEFADNEEMFLRLIENKAWRKRGETEDFAGSLIRIGSEGATFDVAGEEVTIALADLTSDSRGKVLRIQDLCRRMSAEPKR